MIQWLERIAHGLQRLAAFGRRSRLNLMILNGAAVLLLLVLCCCLPLMISVASTPTSGPAPLPDRPANTAGPTNTTGPTNTSGPTSTPGPTDTPRPTNTPAPTNTPRPTDTPEPTNTPRPTEDPAEARRELIERAFSAWDGSHIKLVAYVKERMNDPGSFEHVETRYGDRGDYIQVYMKFRGKNAFGALILQEILAKAEINGDILEVTTQ